MFGLDMRRCKHVQDTWIPAVRCQGGLGLRAFRNSLRVLSSGGIRSRSGDCPNLLSIRGPIFRFLL